MAADRVIRRATAGAVAGVAAMASYEHAYALVRAHGEAGRTGRPVSLTMDGLIYATSIVMLDSARRKAPVPALARWLLGLGIAATLAANVAHGLGDGLAGATVAAWPAVALAGSYELLMMIIRSAAGPPEQSAQPPRDAHIKHESTSPGVCQCCAMGIPGVAVQPVDEGNSESAVQFLIEWVSDGEAEARRYLADHAEPEGASRTCRAALRP